MQNILIDMEDTPFIIWNKNLNTDSFVNSFLDEVKDYINNLHAIEVKSGKKVMVCAMEEDYTSMINSIVSDTILEMTPDNTYFRINNNIIYIENKNEINLIFNTYNVSNYESKIFIKDKRTQELMIFSYCRTEDNKYSYDINKNFKESYYIYNDRDENFKTNNKQKWSLEKNIITVFNRGVNSEFKEETQYILQDTFLVKNDEKNIVKNITENHEGKKITYSLDLKNCNFSYIKLSGQDEFLRANVSSSVLKKLRTSTILNLSNVEIKAIQDNIKATLTIAQKEDNFDKIIEMLRNCDDLENLAGDKINKEQIVDIKELVEYSTKIIAENKPHIFNLGEDIKAELQIANEFVVRQKIINKDVSGISFAEFDPVFDYKSISFLGYTKLLFDDIEEKTKQHLNSVTTPTEQKSKLPRYRN